MSSEQMDVKYNNGVTSEKFFLDALENFQKLAEQDPEIYLPEVSKTMQNLVNLYIDMNSYNEAETLCQKILDKYKKLVEINPNYLQLVAEMQKQLGNLHNAIRKFKEAEKENFKPQIKPNEFMLKDLDLYEIDEGVKTSKQETQLIGEFTNQIKDLINQGKYYFQNKEIVKAIISLKEANNISKKIGNQQFISHTGDILNLYENKLEERKDRLKRNKLKIHSQIYKDKLMRCPLHVKTNIECARIDDIKDIIEKPKLFGFFMYEFPKDLENEKSVSQDIKFQKKVEKNKEYQKEIEKIKILIEKTNEDSLIDIQLPEEISGFDVKTCDFCKVARSFDFGLILLSTLNPNAYLEAGMFLSLGKKVICINNESVLPKVPFDLTPFFYLPYKTLEQLESNWSKKIPDALNTIKNSYMN